MIENPEGKPPLRRPMYRWKNNNNMDIKQIWYEQTGFIWLRIGTNGWIL
jgi:hypothetical protein